MGDTFTYVFGTLAVIFLFAAVVNKIRTLVRRNRRETKELIRRNGGTEAAPVKLDDPFAPTDGSSAQDVYLWR